MLESVLVAVRVYQVGKVQGLVEVLEPVQGRVQELVVDWVLERVEELVLERVMVLGLAMGQELVTVSGLGLELVLVRKMESHSYPN